VFSCSFNTVHVYQRNVICMSSLCPILKLNTLILNTRELWPRALQWICTFCSVIGLCIARLHAIKVCGGMGDVIPLVINLGARRSCYRHASVALITGSNLQCQLGKTLLDSIAYLDTVGMETQTTNPFLSDRGMRGNVVVETVRYKPESHGLEAR
jgi:hypothetical protein